MRGVPIIAIAISFAVAYAMLSGAGFTAATGAGGGGGIVQEVDDQANKSVGINGSAGTQDDGDIVGFIINGSDKLLDFFLLGLTIGSVLGNLGFPEWFTTPVGWVIQITLTVAFVQVVINRVVR